MKSTWDDCWRYLQYDIGLHKLNEAAETAELRKKAHKFDS